MLNPLPLVKLFLMIATCTLAGRVCSQHALQGRVTDRSGVKFDYCKLTLKKDSTVIATRFADSTGAFVFEDLPADTFRLTINTPFSSTDTLISSLQLGFLEISLSEGEELDGFTLTATRPAVIRLVDRIIFNPAAIPVLAGGNAVDVLQFAPGVFIQGKSIMLAGGKSCRVLLNDKLVPLEGAELISFIYSIPTEDIHHVEIMEAIPAKYAASVSGGLIHIKLRAGAKGRLSTGSIRNSTRQGIYTSDDFGLNYSYRRNKLSVYSNLSGMIGNYGHFTSRAIEFPQDTWEEKSQAKNHYQTYTAGLGINYDLNSRTELGVLYVGNYDLGYTRKHAGADYLNASRELISRNDNNSSRNYTGLLNSVSFNLSHTFDTLMRQVAFVVDYSDRRRDENVSFRNLFTQVGSGDSLTARKTLNGNKAGFLSGGVDFTLPYRGFDITTGLRASFALNDNDLAVYNTASPEAVFDEALSNRFRYTENIQAAYFSIGRKVNKWSFLLALRAENTQTLGNQLTTGERTVRNYPQLNPQVFAMYSQKEDLTWNFVYNRNFFRPNFNELNPFRIYNSAFSYSEGNPLLKPGVTHNFRLTNNFRRTSTSVMFGYAKDNPSDVTLTDSITLIERNTIANYLDNYNFSVNFTYQLIDVKRWSLNLILQGFAYSARSGRPEIAFDRITNLNFMFIGYSSYAFDRKQTFFMQLSLYYMTPWVQNIQSVSMRPAYNFELKKTFSDRRFSVSLSTSDLFRIGRARTKLTTNGVTTRTSSYEDSQCVYLELSYNFGNRNINVNQKSTGSTGESSRYKTDK